MDKGKGVGERGIRVGGARGRRTMEEGEGGKCPSYGHGTKKPKNANLIKF